MTTDKKPRAATKAAASPDEVLRRRAEQQYEAELAALAAQDDGARPPSWRLSPAAVRTYLLGGTLKDGTAISP